jgi:Fic family protein
MCLPVLSRGKEGDLEITPWLEWFLDCLNRAFDKAETILAAVLKKAPFWEVHGATAFNERRRKILNELMNGFEGKLTSSKMGKAWQVVAGHGAARDRGPRFVLVKDAAGGRSTSYSPVD